MARPDAARVGGVAIGIAFAAAALAVFLSGRVPEGPVAVDWDATRCARCGMLISEPAFAAQLHRVDGDVRHYDDPGCLLADLARVPAAEVHAAWLHHHRDERWIPLDGAAFVRVPHSPMGYRLGAVAAGAEPGALDLAAAHATVGEALARRERP